MPVLAPLLTVRRLSLAFALPQGGRASVLDGLSLDIAPQEALALVGESGSGKSVFALALLRLLDRHAEITDGEIRIEGEDLLHASDKRMQDLRGKTLAIIFQNPASSLNPIRRIGRQIADVLLAHGERSADAARRRAVQMLARVGIQDAARRANAYPFELSGGMKQRVMIALALAASPRLLIADEATTGLDVTTQAMVMDLIHEQARANNMATLLITHDLALAAERCDRIAVIHAGQLVESAPAARLLTAARHPYTRALLTATPHAGSTLANLRAIPGQAPDTAAADLPACRYYARCDRRTELCKSLPPMQTASSNGAHVVACHHPL
ncbi:ABC transporter ATP-binding protein [Acidisoma silvae]|uniref:ABC transporter ATP-binding protein n=1 Tax=Acidisoma silvae TaxID=2802396 RepID=A0A963YVN7_9PROT|nr:ABC transporter ATP-binding protein [Acidisoma silvae]MCB8877993.1 ABC transporter ATP-binding protein [Acidisoma silvae]